MSSHKEHLTKHFQQLLRIYGEQKAKLLLSKAGLTWNGTFVMRADGSEPTSQDCDQYLAVVESLMGKISYHSALVVFILGGCDCSRCQREKAQAST